MLVEIDAASAENTWTLIVEARGSQIVMFLLLSIGLRLQIRNTFVLVKLIKTSGDIMVLLILHNFDQVTFNVLHLGKVILLALPIWIRLLKRGLSHHSILTLSGHLSWLSSLILTSNKIL